jgi:hypothetical protein
MSVFDEASRNDRKIGRIVNIRLKILTIVWHVKNLISSCSNGIDGPGEPQPRHMRRDMAHVRHSLILAFHKLVKSHVLKVELAGLARYGIPCESKKINPTKIPRNSSQSPWGWEFSEPGCSNARPLLPYMAWITRFLQLMSTFAVRVAWDNAIPSIR